MNILNQINENEYLKIKVKDLENDLAKEQNKAQYFKKAQKRIEELEYKLLIVEKALDLACKELHCELENPENELYTKTPDEYIDYFKKMANLLNKGENNGN